MIGLLQRVTQASVVVGGQPVGAIGPGLMVLVCAEKGDTEREADALLAKLLGYRLGSACNPGSSHCLLQTHTF